MLTTMTGSGHDEAEEQRIKEYVSKSSFPTPAEVGIESMNVNADK